jgi:hypothetical protein
VATPNLCSHAHTHTCSRTHTHNSHLKTKKKEIDSLNKGRDQGKRKDLAYLASRLFPGVDTHAIARWAMLYNCLGTIPISSIPNDVLGEEEKDLVPSL